MHVVIVGTSIAGIRSAQALRAEGHEGPITVVGAEATDPYDKPPLSKSLLFDEQPKPATLITNTQAADSEISLRLGEPATGLDTTRRRLQLGNDSLEYDVLIVATGASARPSPWDRTEGVHSLRTLDDCSALRADLASGQPLLIVGAGFIGAEVAGGARKLGIPTTLIDPAPMPAARVVGRLLAPHFANLHSNRGVDTRFGTGVESIKPGSSTRLRARLTDGSTIDAHAALICIGATPGTPWLANSGIPIADGVQCDHIGRVDGTRHVYALGDVAAWRLPDGTNTRIEHWTNAVEQSTILARHIVRGLGPATYQPDRYVWSDQHDWKIQLVGQPAAGKDVRVYGSFDGEGAKAAAVFGDISGRIAGGVTVNWTRASMHIRRALTNGSAYTDVLATLAQLGEPVCA